MRVHWKTPFGYNWSVRLNGEENRDVLCADEEKGFAVVAKCYPGTSHPIAAVFLSPEELARNPLILQDMVVEEFRGDVEISWRGRSEQEAAARAAALEWAALFPPESWAMIEAAESGKIAA